jgi:hypothetical protein
MGALDPRLESTGSLKYLLQQLLRGYSHLDPVASRVKPVPFAITERLHQYAATPTAQVIADLAILGFFFSYDQANILLHCPPPIPNLSLSTTSPFALAEFFYQLYLSTFPLFQQLLLLPFASLARKTARKTKLLATPVVDILGSARCLP